MQLTSMQGQDCKASIVNALKPEVFFFLEGGGGGGSTEGVQVCACIILFNDLMYLYVPYSQCSEETYISFVEAWHQGPVHDLFVLRILYTVNKDG